MPTTPCTGSPVPGWQKRHPERWARERAALRASGWHHRIRYRDGLVAVRVDYPIPGVGVARLVVRFPQTYPWAGADFYDPHDDLGAGRHRMPGSGGLLCLEHEIDRDPEATVAQVLARQLPRLRAAKVAGPEAAAQGLEHPTALPFLAFDPATLVVLVPDQTIPVRVRSGVLVARLGVRPGGLIGSGVVEQILGQELKVVTPARDLSELFPLRVFGRWIRDHEYRVGEDPRAVWWRIRTRLAPLEVEVNPGEVAPESVELIGLLVPSVETGYRAVGDGWVFLIRARGRHHSTGRYRESFALAKAQYLDDASVATRSPHAAALAGKHVMVVGCGAVGHHVATDLARGGVARLDLLDRDRVDIATRSRQPSHLPSLGEPKVSLLGLTLRHSHPTATFLTVHGDVTRLWEPLAPVHREAAALARQSLYGCDLLVDATADPAATALLGALRYAAGKPILSVAATAGGWGGWVAMADPNSGTGCLECLALHRRDGTVPVPPEDPAGWVHPRRCILPTYGGSNGDLATVAYHAGRVASHWLATGDTLGDAYAVAALRDEAGSPVPVSWQTAPIPFHPACGQHPAAHTTAG